MIHRIILDFTTLSRSLFLSRSFVVRNRDDGGQLTILGGGAFEFTCSACCLLDFHRLLSISLIFHGNLMRSFPAVKHVVTGGCVCVYLCAFANSLGNTRRLLGFSSPLSAT